MWLDRNPGTGYDTLLLRMIPGDLLSSFPHSRSCSSSSTSSSSFIEVRRYQHVCTLNIQEKSLTIVGNSESNAQINFNSCDLFKSLDSIALPVLARISF